MTRLTPESTKIPVSFQVGFVFHFNTIDTSGKLDVVNVSIHLREDGKIAFLQNLKNVMASLPQSEIRSDTLVSSTIQHLIERDFHQLDL
jgi:hypothetical protein